MARQYAAYHAPWLLLDFMAVYLLTYLLTYWTLLWMGVDIADSECTSGFDKKARYERENDECSQGGIAAKTDNTGRTICRRNWCLRTANDLASAAFLKNKTDDDIVATCNAACRRRGTANDAEWPDCLPRTRCRMEQLIDSAQNYRPNRQVTWTLLSHSQRRTCVDYRGALLFNRLLVRWLTEFKADCCSPVSVKKRSMNISEMKKTAGAVQISRFFQSC